MTKNELMNKIIINGDDFGKSPEINDGIAEGFRLGKINRTTIMANMPHFIEAVELAKKENFWDKVGLHINLTEGEPLCSAMKSEKRLTDNGIMSKTLITNLRKGMILSKSERNIIKAEIKAQIQRFKDETPSLLHIDSHMHVHNELQIFPLLIPIIKSSGFTDLRIARNLMNGNKIKYMYKTLLNFIIRQYFTSTKFMGSFDDFTKYYNNGSVEIMVHPILINGQLYDIVNTDLINFNTYPYDRINLYSGSI